MADWSPNLSRLGKPRYLAIADAIAEDIRNGRLAPSDRLPPQRKLARRLDVDFTTDRDEQALWAKWHETIIYGGVHYSRRD